MSILICLLSKYGMLSLFSAIFYLTFDSSPCTIILTLGISLIYIGFSMTFAIFNVMSSPTVGTGKHQVKMILLIFLEQNDENSIFVGKSQDRQIIKSSFTLYKYF